VKTGFVFGLIVAVVFISSVFWELPSDAGLAEKAAVVMMGMALIALSVMILTRGRSRERTFLYPPLPARRGVCAGGAGGRGAAVGVGALGRS
jgi:hypothetical protein